MSNLDWHLRYNFYPPLGWLRPFAERAIEMASQGVTHHPVRLESGHGLADNAGREITAQELIDELRLLDHVDLTD